MSKKQHPAHSIPLLNYFQSLKEVKVYIAAGWMVALLWWFPESLTHWKFSQYIDWKCPNYVSLGKYVRIHSIIQRWGQEFVNFKDLWWRCKDRKTIYVSSKHVVVGIKDTNHSLVNDSVFTKQKVTWNFQKTLFPSLLLMDTN